MVYTPLSSRTSFPPIAIIQIATRPTNSSKAVARTNVVPWNSSIKTTSNHKWFIDNHILLSPQRLIDAIPEDAIIATPILINSLIIDPDPTACDCAVPHTLSRTLKDLELWHQRYSHCSHHTLNLTWKCVNGIPDIPSSTVYFRCPLQSFTADLPTKPNTLSLARPFIWIFPLSVDRQTSQICLNMKESQRLRWFPRYHRCCHLLPSDPPYQE